MPEAKKKSAWFEKVPPEILFSPGGVILVFLALNTEGIDLILPPVIGQIIALPLEIIFLILVIYIVKPSLKSLIIPFLIERLPLISAISPTWFLWLLVLLDIPILKAILPTQLIRRIFLMSD